MMHNLAQKTINTIGQRTGYAEFLALEYLLLRQRLSGRIEHPELNVNIFQTNQTALSGPFQSFNFEAFLMSGSPVWRDAFVSTALRPLMAKHTHSKEGAWLHPKGKWGTGNAVLLDSFQEEASKLIKLAWLIRRDDVTSPHDPDILEKEALNQFLIHRKILRNPTTGLWHNGFDWLPDQLSPGHWSRGHGWLLRGLVQSLQYSINSNVAAQLGEMLEETCSSLLKYQHEDGLWRAIVHVTSDMSPPESSGSAMIAASLLSGMRLHVLPRDTYESAAKRCTNSLIHDYLRDNSVVLGACPGPGPLFALDDYLYPARFPDDESHGIAAMLALHCELSLNT